MAGCDPGTMPFLAHFLAEGLAVGPAGDTLLILNPQGVVMRYAVEILGSAAVLFIASAVGAVGSWALPVSAAALLMGAVIGAIAMEEHDVDAAERLLGFEALAETPLPVAAEEPWLEAA